MPGGKGMKRIAGGVERGWTKRLHRFAVPAKLIAVASGQGDHLRDRPEHRIELRKRTAADDRDPSLQNIVERRQKPAQKFIRGNGVGPVDDLDERSVEINEQARAIEKRRGWTRKDARIGTDRHQTPFAVIDSG